MRDHKKLEAFGLADELAITVYRITQTFPSNEQFGLTSQMRRAAVSIGANIVEGAARRTESDYVRFLNIAYASSRELEFEISLATRLGYIPESQRTQLHTLSSRTCKALRSLVAAFSARRSWQSG